MYKVRCKDEGKGSTTYSDKTEALQACNDRAECTSVVSDAYSDPKKFELCNGLKYLLKKANMSILVAERLSF